LLGECLTAAEIAVAAVEPQASGRFTVPERPPPDDKWRVCQLTSSPSPAPRVPPRAV
jgi:hypothetical protein